MQQPPFPMNHFTTLSHGKSQLMCLDKKLKITQVQTTAYYSTVRTVHPCCYETFFSFLYTFFCEKYLNAIFVPKYVSKFLFEILCKQDWILPEFCFAPIYLSFSYLILLSHYSNRLFWCMCLHIFEVILYWMNVDFPIFIICSDCSHGLCLIIIYDNLNGIRKFIYKRKILNKKCASHLVSVPIHSINLFWKEFIWKFAIV